MRQNKGVPASPSGHSGFAPSPKGLGHSESVPNAVLFLDIDGVVLSGDELHSTRNPRHLPPHKLALVKEVCDRTGAVVVVSSTWRYSDETADRLRFAGLPLHRRWRTPSPEAVNGIFPGLSRGTEIHRWLARNPVSAFAIVDDDSDMLPEQMPHFVKTPWQTGIDRHHVERICAILAQGMSAGPAKTPQAVEGEARQPGPEGMRP